MLRQVIRRAVLGAILGGVGTALYVLLPSVLGGSGAGLGPAFRAGIGGAVIGFLIGALERLAERWLGDSE